VNRLVSINSLANANAKEVLNVTFILEEKVAAKQFAEFIDRRVIIRENETIVGIESNDAIFADVQAWIDLGRNEST